MGDAVPDAEVKDVPPPAGTSADGGSFPGWKIKIEAGQAYMQEFGTGRAYFVPNGRINKAARYLRQQDVMDGLTLFLTPQLGKSARGVCRCRRRCPALFDIDYLLANRAWFFEHATHDDAVAELGKAMAWNLKQFQALYVLRSGIKVPRLA